MSAEEVSFPVEPHPLAGISVHAGGRIHKTVAVVNCKVDEAVMRKCIVTTPLISEDRCTRSHTLFYQSDEGVVVTSIIRTLHKKALSSGTTESTKYPLAKDSSAAMIFSVAELGLVYLYQVSWSTNLCRAATSTKKIFSHAEAQGCEEVSHRRSTQRQESGTVADTNTIAEQPK